MSADNTLIAAIDIGSSAIRMDIAEHRPDGALHVLDALKKGVQLGKDAFNEGYIREETIRAACDVLRDFKKVMDSYGVLRCTRAVATSAVRESSNSDTFLDRVLMGTGLDVEVIDGPEENRLTLSAVLESLRAGADLDKGKALLVEVGGGSTDVTLLEASEPVQSGTFPIGSIRLRAGVSAAGSHDQRVRLLKRQVSNLLANVRHSIAVKEASSFIAIGGDVRFAAAALKGGTREPGPVAIPRDAFLELVDAVARLTVEGLVKKYAISYMEAETLAPALLVYAQLLKDTLAQSVVISGANIRAGVLQDLVPAEQGKRVKKLAHQILSAARSVGRNSSTTRAMPNGCGICASCCSTSSSPNTA